MLTNDEIHRSSPKIHQHVDMKSEEIRPLKITVIFKHVIGLNKDTAKNMHGQSILLEQALPVIVYCLVLPSDQPQHTHG